MLWMIEKFPIFSPKGGGDLPPTSGCLFPPWCLLTSFPPPHLFGWQWDSSHPSSMWTLPPMGQLNLRLPRQPWPRGLDRLPPRHPGRWLPVPSVSSFSSRCHASSQQSGNPNSETQVSAEINQALRGLRPCSSEFCKVSWRHKALPALCICYRNNLLRSPNPGRTEQQCSKINFGFSLSFSGLHLQWLLCSALWVLLGSSGLQMIDKRHHGEQEPMHVTLIVSDTLVMSKDPS